MKQLKLTKRKDIYFRSHACGALMTDGRGSTLTAKMAEDLKKFQDTIRKGGSITAKQKETMADYIKRRDAPFELSDTAKTYVEDTWLFHEKGYRKKVKSKYLEKGTYQESESLKFLTAVEGVFYGKNLERFYLNNLTGECDNKLKVKDTVRIKDVKTTWDPRTFMDADWDKLKEWQGRAYMKGYGGDVFDLKFVLVDAPPHIVKKEKEYLWREYYHDDMSDEEQHRMEEMLIPLYEQIDRNLVYSNSKLYTREERIKTYTIERDDQLWKQFEERKEFALDYYHTITLDRLIGKYSI